MSDHCRIVCLVLCWLAAFRMEASEPVVLLFDNDVHCAVEGYARMAALKDSLQEDHPYVIALSCGDFLTGNASGTISQGIWPVRLMQSVPYDWITLGNHEFDYGIRHLQEALAPLSDRILCCNYLSLPDSTPVYPPCTLQDYGGRKIGFIGITTPSVPNNTSSAYFNHLTFGGNHCTAIVQHCVDELRKQGAQTVVVLSHLGDHSDPLLTSRQLIAQTHGIDVVLDGHDHSLLSPCRLRNKRGKRVLLLSTGSGFRYIGRVDLPRTGKPRGRLVPVTDIRCRNLAADSLLAEIRQQLEQMDQTPVGYNPFEELASGSRDNKNVRRKETPMGDFCADALREGTGAEIGLINGGAIRAGLPTGGIRMTQLYGIFPFGNTVSVVEVSGQTLLDELNAGVLQLPQPFGGFLQVSGLTMEVVMQPTPHVENVRTTDGHPLLPECTYTVATIDYLLKQAGNGHLFQPRRFVQESCWTDIELLRSYLQKMPDTNDNRYHSGISRILIR